MIPRQIDLVGHPRLVQASVNARRGISQTVREDSGECEQWGVRYVAGSGGEFRRAAIRVVGWKSV